MRTDKRSMTRRVRVYAGEVLMMPATGPTQPQQQKHAPQAASSRPSM
jgi:hypothetical protein